MKSGGVEAVLRYLTDKSPDSHREYLLTPLRVVGAGTPSAFIRICEQGVKQHHARGLGGRKSETAAYWHIVRFPDGSRIKPSERRLCMRKIIEEASLGLWPVVCNEHQNLIFESQDFNVLRPAFDELGLATRSSLLHPIRELRTRMDEVVTIMNAHRRAEDASLIPEMTRIRSERFRNDTDLVEVLASLPKPPGNHGELLAALWSLGWEAELVGKRRKRLRIIEEKQARKREIDVDAMLTLIVRWRLARAHDFMVREKMATALAEESLSAEKKTTQLEQNRRITAGHTGHEEMPSP